MNAIRCGIIGCGSILPWHENGVKLGGVFQMRFYSSTAKMGDALKSGRFGKVVLAEYENKSMRTIEYYQKDSWRGT